MHFILSKSMSTHLENLDAMPCDGSSLLAKEMVYLLQVEVDSIIVVVVCRKRLRRRECQEDRHSIVHGELCGCGRGCMGIFREERDSRGRRQVRWIKLSRVVGDDDDDDDGGLTRLPS